MIRFISSFLFFVIAVFTVLLGISFALLNATEVTINYYVNDAQLPLSLLLVCALGIGLLLGLLLMIMKYVRLYTMIRRLKERVRIAEQEVENLRALPLKDEH